MSQMVDTHHNNIKCIKTATLVGALPLTATQIVLEMISCILKAVKFNCNQLLLYIKHIKYVCMR